MSMTDEEAFDYLALPTFATRSDIIKSYRVLALRWFPHTHPNPERALREFRRITLAANQLLFQESLNYEDLRQEDMYSMFQYLFFNGNISEYDDSIPKDLDSDYSDHSSRPEVELANSVAKELINEESQAKLKAERQRDRKKRRKERKRQEKLQKEIEPEKLQKEIEPEKLQKEIEPEKLQKEIEPEKLQKEIKPEKLQKEIKPDTMPKSKSAKSKKSKASAPNSPNTREIKTKDPIPDLEAEGLSMCLGSDSHCAGDLDLSSAFVAAASGKKQGSSAKSSSSKPKPLVYFDLNEGIEAVVPKSVKLTSQVETPSDQDMDDAISFALQANEAACDLDYYKAVHLYTRAIKLDPFECRYFGNRSFCYMEIEAYRKALDDAEKALKIKANWTTGFYRKGVALMYLKRFEEAEKEFLNVMGKKPDCEEARLEVHKTRALQVMEKGYRKEEAIAATANVSSVHEALTKLRTGAVKVPSGQIDIFEDEDKSLFLSKPKPVKKMEDPLMDPANPGGYATIWIGNVTSQLTEAKLKHLFNQYGDIKSIKVIPESTCAFVNYTTAKAAADAMKKMQNYPFNGRELLLRYRDNTTQVITKKDKESVAIAKKQCPKDECYFWRTTGCTYGPTCYKQHIPENKGKDQKTWMK